jgi:hypothetical protein
VNTCPDNFIWEKDRTKFLIVAPGLYEINFGFFSRKKANVQILVNDEPVLSAVNSQSYIVHHTTASASGCMTGITLIDFLVLPARARMSVTFTGDKYSEGFIGVRKL